MKLILGVGNSVHDGLMLNYVDVGLFVFGEKVFILCLLWDFVIVFDWFVCFFGILMI